ncbi:MAG TPA: metalloregulator ArsR/SmtB family transcription factor [Steroidobacter sp.]|uniref:ArsR/SmtB family transcription factor n=1 Tax=Steroidobacter sp. TaxID=1978227 RepID=UPI002ED91DE0
MRSPEAVTALAALAHEHRLAVYRMLVEAGSEGLPAGEIATRLELAPSSLTFHLQSLQRAGLISQQRRSRQLIYAADFDTMNDLVGYLTENCCAGSASADCGSKCAPAPVERLATSRKTRRTA